MRRAARLVPILIVSLVPLVPAPSAFHELLAGAPLPAFDPVRFEEVAAQSGLRFVTHSGRTARKHQPETMVAGVALLDYDRDGWLDLFVSNYCVWDPAREPVCGDPSAPDYCHPRQYEGLPGSLFHNEGNGTFADVSAASGIRAHVGKGMGVAVADFDGDGFPDIFVANDTTPSFLFLNNRDGTFTESAFDRAVAFGERAEAVSGMGADAADVDNDGRPDIFETALAHESFPLFRNLGAAAFEDVTARSGVGPATLARSGWGNGIVDLNNDGWRDLFAACADVMDPAGAFRERVPMASAVLVNLKDGRFADGSAGAGEDFARKAVHRGAAFGDVDNDGRLDVAVTALDGPLDPWHNA